MRALQIRIQRFGISSMTTAYLSSPATSLIGPPPVGYRIAISSISLAEIVYLIEKARIQPNVYTELKAALADPEHVFKEAAFTSEV